MSRVILNKKLIYMDSMKKPQNGRKTNAAMKKAILFFGGTVKLAVALNANHSNVSKWLYEKRQIPVKYAIKIEQLTKGKIKFRDLRPDLFEV